MRVITRTFEGVTRPAVFRVVPIFDVHLGAKACDEARLRRVVKRIQSDPQARWIGGGDYCDFINPSDKRFSAAALAEWVNLNDLDNLATVQADRFADIVAPIADKCLAVGEGNHETAIARHYHQNVFKHILRRVAADGGQDVEQVHLGYSGWLLLRFVRQGSNGGVTTLRVNVHHGFTGGRLAGAKALAMQRWLWNHDADIVLFGHSHNTGFQTEAVEYVDDTGKVRQHRRIGVYCGTYLRSNLQDATTYAEVAGYNPMPVDGVELALRPGAEDANERIKVISGAGW